MESFTKKLDGIYLKSVTFIEYFNQNIFKMICSHNTAYCILKNISTENNVSFLFK
jgi:hypothetical protein